MKYTQMPADAFKNIQMDAGILLDSFTPASGTIGNILGCTSGGTNFVAQPEFSDYGEDIDCCPVNTKQLKKLTSWTATMSGTFISVSADLAKTLVGAGDKDSSDATHIIPRNDLESTDFDDVWWVGDYSDKNTGSGAGFCAIHLKNALSTGGFQIQSNNKAKGTFSFEFTGHYDLEDQETVPFEIYIKVGA